MSSFPTLPITLLLKKLLDFANKISKFSLSIFLRLQSVFKYICVQYVCIYGIYATYLCGLPAFLKIYYSFLKTLDFLLFQDKVLKIGSTQGYSLVHI